MVYNEQPVCPVFYPCFSEERGSFFAKKRLTQASPYGIVIERDWISGLFFMHKKRWRWKDAYENYFGMY